MAPYHCPTALTALTVTLYSLYLRLCAGLKFPEGEVIIDMAHVCAIMADLWAEEKARTMTVESHTVDEMIDFVFNQ